MVRRWPRRLCHGRMTERLGCGAIEHGIEGGNVQWMAEQVTLPVWAANSQYDGIRLRGAVLRVVTIMAAFVPSATMPHMRYRRNSRLTWAATALPCCESHASSSQVAKWVRTVR